MFIPMMFENARNYGTAIISLAVVVDKWGCASRSTDAARKTTSQPSNHLSQPPSPASVGQRGPASQIGSSCVQILSWKPTLTDPGKEHVRVTSGSDCGSESDPGLSMGRTCAGQKWFKF